MSRLESVSLVARLKLLHLDLPCSLKDRILLLWYLNNKSVSTMPGEAVCTPTFVPLHSFKSEA